MSHFNSFLLRSVAKTSESASEVSHHQAVSLRRAASVKYQAGRSRFWMTALWLFPSPLVPSWGGREEGEGGFWRYASVGKECWKCAGAAEVGSCAGGPTLALVATDGVFWLTVDPASGESDGTFSNSTSTKANNDQNVLLCFWKMHFLFPPPHFFNFSYALWMTSPSPDERSMAPGQTFWHRIQR